LKDCFSFGVKIVLQHKILRKKVLMLLVQLHPELLLSRIAINSREVELTVCAVLSAFPETGFEI
jgi:hypothetical protein